MNALKAYVTTTGVIFGLLTLVHLWRILAESRALARDPFYLLITACSAALCFWAWRVSRRTARWDA